MCHTSVNQAQLFREDNHGGARDAGVESITHSTSADAHRIDKNAQSEERLNSRDLSCKEQVHISFAAMGW